MVRVGIHRNSGNHIVKYVVEGHACYTGNEKTGFVQRLFRRAPETGDVVCAAVSAVAQAAVIGLREVAGIVTGIEISDGYLECIVPGNMDRKQRDKVDTVLETMALALKDIEEQYRDHVKIYEMEV